MTGRGLNTALDWLSRTYWFSDMPGRRFVEPVLRRLTAYKALLFPKSRFKIGSFRLSSTNICNAACVFCSYPQTKMARSVLSLDTVKASKYLLKSTGQYAVDFTPAVGDPLVDIDLEDKVRYLIGEGYKVQFTTNGILLDKHANWILELAEHIVCIYFSLGDLDKDGYYLQYGKDKADKVFENLLALLQSNEARGQPLTLRLQVRNRYYPRVSKSSNYYKDLKPYLHGKVSMHFTPFWDNMSGDVDFTKWSDYMLKRLRKVIKINRPCAQLRNGVVLSNGFVRLCGCRVVGSEMDGLLVGKVGDKLESLNANAAKVREGFYTGNRPNVCNNCSLYDPE